MISILDLVSLTSKSILVAANGDKNVFDKAKSLISDFYYCSIGYIADHNPKILNYLEETDKDNITENYKDIKIDPRTIINENFNEIDKIILRIQSVLLFIANKENNPLEDEAALRYLCQFLHELSCAKFSHCPHKQEVQSLHKQEQELHLSKPLYNHSSQYKDCKKILPLVIFLSYSELKNLILFITLSKFPFINAKGFVEEFLFEQTVLFKNDHRFAGKSLDFKNKGNYFCIDYPAGPQQTMFSILFAFDIINSKLKESLAIEIITTMVDRFNKTATSKSSDKFFKFNERTFELYNKLRFKSSFFRRIADNQTYEDSYQYTADQIAKNHLSKANKQLQDDNKIITEIADADNKKAQEAIKAANYAEARALSSEIKSVEAENKLYALQQSLIKTSSKTYAKSPNTSTFGTVLKYIAEGNRGDLDVLSVLEFIQQTASDRIVVTQKALDSAKEINTVFKRTDKLLELICKLASSYYDTVVQNSDADGRNIFGSGSFSSHESELINNSTNPKFLVDRTLKIGGKSIRLEKHLKIGTDSNNAYTLRIYFYFNPDDKKIYIGYCGKHPKNTKS